MKSAIKLLEEKIESLREDAASSREFAEELLGRAGRSKAWADEQDAQADFLDTLLQRALDADS